MRFPWANTLLLMLILAELASGLFGLLSGSSSGPAFMAVHRVAGYGILAVLLWKGRVVLSSLRKPGVRRRSATPRAASVALSALLAATLALGLAWSFAGPFAFVWFSGVSWHIYVGAALVPVLLWHSAHHTLGLPVSFWAERRSFLRLAGLSVAGVVLWWLAEIGARLGGLSGARRRSTGSYEHPTVAPGAFPVVSWINDSPPPVDASRWRLTIGGAVESEVVLRYDELAGQEGVTATIDCTGGWYSTQEWSGVPVAELLSMARPTPRATSLTVTSVTGYHRRFSMDEARSYMLATHVGGRPLSRGHGFPLRLVAPGKRGFEWVKWVESVEVNESPEWLQPPFPLQ